MLPPFDDEIIVVPVVPLERRLMELGAKVMPFAVLPPLNEIIDPLAIFEAVRPPPGKLFSKASRLFVEPT